MKFILSWADIVGNMTLFDYVIFLLTFILCVIICVFLHELGHYVAFKAFRATPVFGIAGKGINVIPFVTIVEGEQFFWNKLKELGKKAWIFQLIISGAGLFTSLSLGILFLFLGTKIFQDFYALGISFFGVGLHGILVFFGNFRSFESDGQKIIRALKHRDNYELYLRNINYKFVSDRFVEDVEKAIAKGVGRL